MANTTRQNSLLVNQDWTKIYQTFTNADFTSYDFETLRNSMINYLKTYYPETFNDFLESSECRVFRGAAPRLIFPVHENRPRADQHDRR